MYPPRKIYETISKLFEKLREFLKLGRRGHFSFSQNMSVKNIQTESFTFKSFQFLCVRAASRGQIVFA